MPVNRTTVVSRDGLSFLLMIVALVLFLLIAFGVTFGDMTTVEMLGLGLAAFVGGVLA